MGILKNRSTFLSLRKYLLLFIHIYLVLMKKVTLHIPDHKYLFFMELLQNLGFDKSEDIEVPEWQKEVVRNRIKNTNPEEYLSWEEVENQLKID